MKPVSVHVPSVRAVIETIAVKRDFLLNANEKLSASFAQDVFRSTIRDRFHLSVTFLTSLELSDGTKKNCYSISLSDSGGDFMLMSFTSHARNNPPEVATAIFSDYDDMMECMLAVQQYLFSI